MYIQSVYTRFSTHVSFMKILDENSEFRFTKPYLTKLNDGKKWEIQFYYYIGKDRKIFRSSEGLNTSYFVNVHDLTLREQKRRYNERNDLANRNIDIIKDWMQSRIFNPINKAFFIPDTEVKLVDCYREFLTFKSKEGVASGTLVQYTTKANLFFNYLSTVSQKDVKISELRTNLYPDYFYSLRDKNTSSNWFNDTLVFHKMFFKWVIEIKEVSIKNSVIKIKPLAKDDIIKHKAIPSSLIAESFEQLKSYGSPILSLFCKFIVYTLHRPNTLTQLQLKEFDLSTEKVHIPKNKIKTKKAVDLKLAKPLLDLIAGFIEKNDIPSDYYLFGYDWIESVRGRKKEYRLFGKYKSKPSDYTLKFSHFVQKQILTAYKKDPTLAKIFDYGKTTLYGYKHTGVVWLRENNWTLEQIIQLTGHKDTEIAKWYARDFKPAIPKFPDLYSV